MTDVSGQAVQPPTPPSNIAGTSSIDVVALLKEGMANFKSGVQSALAQVGVPSPAPAIAATKAEADAESGIAATKATRDLELKADNSASEAAMGTLPGSASFIAANIRDNVLPKQIALQKDQDELETMKKVGFFDDPLQHVINAFNIPFKEKALDQEKADVDQRLGFSQKVQTLSDSVTAANAASDVVDATALAKFTSQEAFAQATQKAQEISDRSAALGISAANISLQATSASMDLAFKYTNALFEQNRDAYEHIQADANAAYKTAASAADVERTKLASDNEQDKQDAFASIQQVALSKFGMKIDNIQQLKLLGPAKVGLLTEAAGNSTLTNGVDILSPTKSISMLQQLGSNGPSAAVALVVNKLNDISAPIDTNPAYLTLKAEDKIPLKDQQIKNAVGSELANIQPIGGIYSPLTIDKTLTINPAISQLPLAKEMIAGGLGKPGNKLATNPDDFIATGLAQIKRGVSPAAVADQITTIFQASSTNLDNIRRFSLVNIPGLAASQPYNMAVHLPPELRGLSSARGIPPILDMNNKSAVQNYITRLAAAQREAEATGGTGYNVHQ